MSELLYLIVSCNCLACHETSGINGTTVCCVVMVWAHACIYNLMLLYYYLKIIVYDQRKVLGVVLGALCHPACLLSGCRSKSSAVI